MSGLGALALLSAMLPVLHGTTVVMMMMVNCTIKPAHAAMHAVPLASARQPASTQEAMALAMMMMMN